MLSNTQPIAFATFIGFADSVPLQVLPPHTYLNGGICHRACAGGIGGLMAVVLISVACEYNFMLNRLCIHANDYSLSRLSLLLKCYYA